MSDKILVDPKTQGDWIGELLSIFSVADSSLEDLYVRMHGSYGELGRRFPPTGKLYFFIICNDVFYWATGDCEPIGTWEDLKLLRQCYDDLQPLDHEWLMSMLYCCRRRVMRPQSPVGRDRDTQYERDKWPPEVRALFDAAGPERDRKDEG